MRTRKQQLAEATDFHESDLRQTKAIILDCVRAQDDISETIQNYRSGLDLMEAHLLKRVQAIKEKCAERLISLEGRDEPPSEEKPAEGAEVHEIATRQKQKAATA